MSDDLDAVKESAKAVQEAAKAAGQAIEATREVGGWFDRVFTGAIGHTVGRYWTDPMMMRRLEATIFNREKLLRLMHNVDERLRAEGIDTRRIVPPKIMIPMLEGATAEDEDDLHVLWEHLLAAAVNPREQEIKRTYVSILSELSSQDAHTLKSFYAEWWYYERKGREEGRYSSGVGVATADYESAILFYRFGLVMPVHVDVEEYRRRRPVTEGSRTWEDSSLYLEGGEKMGVLSDLSVVCFTELGERFCQSVIGDVEGLYEPPDWSKATQRFSG